VNHAVRQEAVRSPPSTNSQTPRLPLSRLWQELPTEARLQTLRILQRVIGQQLLAPSIAEEVAHEQR
jgi:hypothetical protein